VPFQAKPEQDPNVAYSSPVFYPLEAPLVTDQELPVNVTPEQASVIASKIKKLNRISFAFALPGLALQVAASRSSPFLALLGSILFLVGLGYYAKMKGRDAAWGLVGLLSCIGFVILAVLPKRCHHCKKATGKGKTCQHCQAPAPL
tara:strand:- start:3 stop:440 length:438 start_codon:yes stop_codon:yes gene_type:complete